MFGFVTNRADNIQIGPRETTFPIIAFEVAGSGEWAEQILSETVDLIAVAGADTSDARKSVEAAVRTSLWWDFGFIPGYSLLIFTVAPALGRKVGLQVWTPLGRAVGWGGLLAGGLDVIENAALFQVMADTSRDVWALGAALASWGKWVLVLISVAFGLVGLGRLGVRAVKRVVSTKR